MTKPTGEPTKYYPSEYDTVRNNLRRQLLTEIRKGEGENE